jgi:hypothetical protein
MRVGGKRHVLAALLPRKGPNIRFTEGCVRRSASLEGAEILALTEIRSPKSPARGQPLPTTLSRPTY